MKYVVRAVEAVATAIGMSDANASGLRRAAVYAVFAGVAAALVAFGDQVAGLELGSPAKELIVLAIGALAAGIDKRRRASS